MHILEDLWYGITPIETAVPQSEEYKQAMHKLVEDQKTLRNIVPENSKAVLTDYDDGQVKLQDLAERAAFVEGFRLGVKIILDVVAEKRV